MRVKFFPNKGFSLLELLVVIAILSVVAAFTIPFLQSSQTSSQLDADQASVITIIRRAHQQAVSGYQDDAWGIYFDNDQDRIILFKGQSYNSRDTSFDYQYDLASLTELTTSFGQEIYFESRSGMPSAEGDIIIANNNQQTRTITIQANGLIVHE